MPTKLNNVEQNYVKISNYFNSRKKCFSDAYEMIIIRSLNFKISDEELELKPVLLCTTLSLKHNFRGIARMIIIVLFLYLFIFFF